jgi:hypothetical protein
MPPLEMTGVQRLLLPSGVISELMTKSEKCHELQVPGLCPLLRVKRTKYAKRRETGRE